MTGGTSATVVGLGATPYSATQLRIATTALDLFAQHGVNGTSLQMIADALGVTKAAVYHQFKTKEGIVIAAMEAELRNLEGALEAAEGAPGPDSRERLLSKVIELAVARRRMVNTLLYDPVVVRLLAGHRPFQQFMERLFRALLDDEADAEARLRVAMIASAIGGAVTHPLVADLDEETLRKGLLDLTRQFLATAR
jgi:AcrR family transcriptional regulator